MRWFRASLLKLDASSAAVMTQRRARCAGCRAQSSLSDVDTARAESSE